MNRNTRQMIVLLFLSAFAGCQHASMTPSKSQAYQKESGMELGNFSVSLSVKDLAVSRAFYEDLGFVMVGGDPDQNWIILRNGAAIIGLFQGMFEGNMLTFNPGWSAEGENLDEFTDIRQIQQHLKQKGMQLADEADMNSEGPASLMLADPDGNVILVDQHR